MASRSAQFLLASVLVVICLCEGFSNNNQKIEQSSNFVTQPAKNSFQSWSDWLDKRGLGSGSSWGFGEPSGHQFQQWKEWMEKRGLNGPPPKGFGQFGRSDLQQWRDWYRKRSLKVPAFPAFGQSGRLQQWSDWMSKRGFDAPSMGFGNPDPDNGFQSWSDFAKRMSDLRVNPMKNLDKFNPSPDTFIPAFYKNYLDSWNSYYKRNADKRQLGYVPSGFGSFSRYFTDGLQDWRSTYQGAKRNDKEKSDKE